VGIETNRASATSRCMSPAVDARKSKFVHHCFTIYSSLVATLLLSNMLFETTKEQVS